VLEFTISCLFPGIPYFFIDRSRGHIVDEKNGSKSAAPCLQHAGISCVLGASSIPLLSDLDSFSRIPGFVAIIPAARWISSNFLATKSGLERSPHVVGGEGLLVLLVCLLFALTNTGLIVRHAAVCTPWEGASVMDAGRVRQPFDKYTHWTATGALGAMDSLLII
ncbi:hypothetical protein JOM56_001704, partial [Amanita muscaria]